MALSNVFWYELSSNFAVSQALHSNDEGLRREFCRCAQENPCNVEKKGPKSNICLMFGVAFMDLYSRTINFFLFLTDERYHHLLTKILRISLLYSSFYRVHLTK